MSSWYSSIFLKSTSVLLANKIKVKLLIIGNGSMQNEIDSYIEKNNLKSNVKIINDIITGTKVLGQALLRLDEYLSTNL